MGPMPEHSSDIRYARVREHEWLCDAPATYTLPVDKMTAGDADKGLQLLGALSPDRLPIPVDIAQSANKKFNQS